MRRNSALVIVAAAVCFALCVSAPTSALDCCPSCTGNQGQCYVSDEIYGSYTKGGDCLDACPGSCVKASSSTYICGLEPCGPLTCSPDDVADTHAAPGLRGGERRLSVPAGTCIAGHNASGMPLLNDGSWWGSYSYHVSMATLKRKYEQVRVVDHWSSNPATNGFSVANGGNTMYWPVQNMQQWTLDARNTEYIAFNFSLGQGDYATPYAATDDIIVTFQHVPATHNMFFLAYDAQHPPNTLISNVSMANTSPNGELPTIYADGKSVYVLMGTTLHYWNAFLPLDVSTVNITVTDCNIAGSKDQATTLKKAAVRGGKFMFTAYKPYGPKSTQLCTTDLSTGVTGPLLPTLPTYTRAYDSLEVEFFPNAVLYTSAGGTIAVGDPVACEISSPSAGGKSVCHWVNEELKQETTYEFTKLYTNYHIPSNPNGVHQWVIWNDVVVYRTYAEVFTYSYFGFNLTSKEVYPIALVFGVPNTDCFQFTGDGSDQYETHSFTNAFMLANGTVLLVDEYTSEAYSGQQNAVVAVTSPLVRPDLVGCAAPAEYAERGVTTSAVTGGCSLHGGICIAGECHCQPGCSGADCTSGAAYCNPAPPVQDDDF